MPAVCQRASKGEVGNGFPLENCGNDERANPRSVHGRPRCNRRLSATCRLLLPIAVAALLISACRTPPEPPPRMRWARAWVDAFNSHRLENFGLLLAPAATYEDPVSNGPRSGASLAYHLVARWTKFPTEHYEIERVFGDGNVVVTEWRATGIGVRTKGNPLRGVFLLTVQGDAIAGVRAYYDASGVREVLMAPSIQAGPDKR